MFVSVPDCPDVPDVYDINVDMSNVFVITASIFKC